MNEQFEVLAERPKPAEMRGTKASALSVAVAATADTGGCVKMPPLGETERKNIINRLTSYCFRRRSLVRMRKQEDGSYLIWAERKE